MTARARKSNESFKRYRSALKKEATVLKQRLRGRMLYESARYVIDPEAGRRPVLETRPPARLAGCGPLPKDIPVASNGMIYVSRNA
jgi:hypothetical protein